MAAEMRAVGVFAHSSVALATMEEGSGGQA
jgi:hypothetical protein